MQTHLACAGRPRATFRPTFEILEDRFCPTNMMPMVSVLATPVSQCQVRLTGQVWDEAPAGLTVNFTGVYQGTVTTNSTGGFNIVVTASGLGNITAQVTDIEGLTGFGGAMVSSFPPMLNQFTAIHETGDVWRFTGRVMDESAAGLQVQFGGILAGRTAQVQADGTFCLVVDLGDTEGLATATTSDWWGLASNIAQTLVHSA